VIRAPGFERAFDDATDAIEWNRRCGPPGSVVYRVSDGKPLTRPLGTKFSNEPFRK
jgi:hypothetical protein